VEDFGYATVRPLSLTVGPSCPTSITAQLHEIIFQKKSVCIHFDPRGKGSKGREEVKGSLLYFSLTRTSHTSPLALRPNPNMIHPRGYYACISFPGETRILDPARQRTGKRDCRPDYIFNIFFSFGLFPPLAGGGGGAPRFRRRGHATPRHARPRSVLYWSTAFSTPPGPKRFLSLFPIFLSFLDIIILP